MHTRSVKIRKKKVISDAVFEKILADPTLRDKIMDATGLRENSVRSLAYRRSHNRIMDINILSVIKRHTGWTNKEIFVVHINDA